MINIRLNNNTLVNIVAEKIREAIIYGELPPNTKISMRQLSKKFGISRTPLREAARIIEAEGLAIYVPRKGFIIKSLNENDVNKIYEIREILEVYACKLACKNITDLNLKKIEKIKKKIENLKYKFSHKSKKDIKLLHKLNKEFHFTIYELSNNKILIDLILNLWNKSSCIIYYIFQTPGRLENLIKEHEDIYLSLKNKNENDIEKAIKKHLNITKKLVMNCIKNNIK